MASWFPWDPSFQDFSGEKKRHKTLIEYVKMWSVSFWMLRYSSMVLTLFKARMYQTITAKKKKHTLPKKSRIACLHVSTFLFLAWEIVELIPLRFPMWVPPVLQLVPESAPGLQLRLHRVPAAASRRGPSGAAQEIGQGRGKGSPGESHGYPWLLPSHNDDMMGSMVCLGMIMDRMGL